MRHVRASFALDVVEPASGAVRPVVTGMLSLVSPSRDQMPMVLDFLMGLAVKHVGGVVFERGAPPPSDRETPSPAAAPGPVPAT